MRRVGMAWAGIALLVSTSPLFAADPSDSRGDYGVTLAITGEAARAESVFVTMLSHTRGDSRALNNLGNLRLLRGETGVALAFYERALRGDSLDAGIQLNRAAAVLKKFQAAIKLRKIKPAKAKPAGKTVKEFQVIGEAASGEAALKLVSDYIPDIVLLDLIMPGMDGVETTRRIRQMDSGARSSVSGLKARLGEGA